MHEASTLSSQRKLLPRLTDRVPLGNTGLQVSPVCLGMTEDPATVCAAFDAGINFFFLTADMHWPMYEQTRQGLRMLLERGRSVRDEIVVGLCAYVTQPDFCWYPYQEVLAELPSLRRADLTIAGGSYRNDFSTRLDVYREHLRRRHVGSRGIGTTFHDRATALQAIEERVIDIAFVRYNPAHPKAREVIFPHTAARSAPERPTVFSFKSTFGFISSEKNYAELGIGKKFWRPHVTDYYRFALTEAGVDGLLASPPNPRAVGELVAALERGPLSAEQQAYLIKLGALWDGQAEVA